MYQVIHRALPKKNIIILISDVGRPAHISNSLNDLMMNTARRSQVWILKKLFEGEPKLSDFNLEEQTLRDINDGGKIRT